MFIGHTVFFQLPGLFRNPYFFIYNFHSHILNLQFLSVNLLFCPRLYPEILSQVNFNSVTFEFSFCHSTKKRTSFLFFGLVPWNLSDKSILLRASCSERMVGENGDFCVYSRSSSSRSKTCD